MARVSLLVAALFIFAYIQTGEGLKCYHCVQPHGGECDEPTKTDSFIKTCTDEAHEVCVTQNTTLAIGGGQITRDCAVRTVCNQPRGATVNTTCEMCEGDLCNSSSNAVPNFFIISIISLMFFKIFV